MFGVPRIRTDSSGRPWTRLGELGPTRPNQTVSNIPDTADSTDDDAYARIMISISISLMVVFPLSTRSRSVFYSNARRILFKIKPTKVRTSRQRQMITNIAMIIAADVR